MAAGIPGVAVSMKRAVESMGIARTARTLLKLNQVDGFDCQGCAWPDPDPSHRHTAEFCENGAKAVAEEATTDHILPAFFVEHSIEDLRQHTDYWLGHQGRLIHPVVRRRDATHYEPISWDDAFELIGQTLRGLDDPDEAIFYTSGKTSNEAAFTYQLFARAFGTNNLPDCSNMCHESTSVALAETIGIGKGSVSLEDIYEAKLIVVSGQNPGTNHPRMLTALEKAKDNGARIISINPLPEAGLLRFKNPQNARGLAGAGTGLSDLHLPVRINGDLALWQAIGSLILEAEEAAGNDGSVLDLDFIERHTTGFEEWAREIKNLDWDRVLEVDRADPRPDPRGRRHDARLRRDRALLGDGHHPAPQRRRHHQGVRQRRDAAGQHRQARCRAVPRARALQRPGRPHDGDLGEGARPLPRRACATSTASSRRASTVYDTVDAIRALRDGKAKVFVAMGGNFVSAAPDTVVTEEAMEQAELTVNVSTKLNRSHVRCGRVSLILPALGRSERDRTGGIDQRVTVEDSMSAVHASRGPLKPASPDLRSEVDIVCSIAEATLGTDGPGAVVGVPLRLRATSAGHLPRRARLRVVRREGEPARRLRAAAPSARLAHVPDQVRARRSSRASPMDVINVPEGRLLLQSLRSHDQFNTTIYGLSDRYRGISGGRRVVFLHRDDIAAFGFGEGDTVDLVSEWEDGTERSVPSFRIVEYDTPRGCAAAYYPEVNPLVPLDSTAEGSNCPTSKSVIIRLEPTLGRRGDLHEHRATPVGSDRGHKSDVEPHQLS